MRRPFISLESTTGFSVCLCLNTEIGVLLNLLYVWIISYLLNILLRFWRLTCFGRKKDLGYKRKKKKKKEEEDETYKVPGEIKRSSDLEEGGGVGPSS